MITTKIKKPKAQKCVVKWKIKLEDYKHCLKESQLENKINQLYWIHKKNELVLKSQQRSRSRKHKICFEEVIKIALSGNDDKKIQSVDSMEISAYGTSKDLVCRKEEIKYKYIISNTKMINYDYIRK